MSGRLGQRRTAFQKETHEKKGGRLERGFVKRGGGGGGENRGT